MGPTSEQERAILLEQDFMGNTVRLQGQEGYVNAAAKTRRSKNMSVFLFNQGQVKSMETASFLQEHVHTWCLAMASASGAPPTAA